MPEDSLYCFLQPLGGKEFFAEHFAGICIDPVSVLCPLQKTIVYDHFLGWGILRIIQILIQLGEQNGGK